MRVKMKTMFERKLTIQKQKNSDRLQVKMTIPTEIVEKMKLSENSNLVVILYNPLTNEIRVKKK